MGSSSQLSLKGDNEVGPVSITGGVVFLSGGLNSGTGNAVTLTDAAVAVIGGGGSVGGLSTFGSSIALSQPGAGSGFGSSLSTTSATFDSASSIRMKLGSHLTSTGAIDLGGASLGLDPVSNGVRCDGRPLGTVSTLVSTTDTLTGTFGNAPRWRHGLGQLR